MPILESLENRRLLAGVTPPGGGGGLFDVQNGPLANLGADLITVYHDYINYEAAGGTGPFVSTKSDVIKFADRNTVEIDATGTGSTATYVAALQGLGMFVVATDPKVNIVEGFIPVASLPQLASQAQTLNAVPVYAPHANFVGVANNQADATLNAPAARAAFGVDGTGQKIGVLSTSVSEYAGGLADSVRTGDLPPNVQVIQDYPAGPPTTPMIPNFRTDEGRAMLEQIHDIAPGAQLGFATAFIGPVSFANNIRALFQAGYTTIVDDAGYFLDAFYQTGEIQNAINEVVAQGATYLSSAGNQGDSGYSSQFRGVNATVTGVSPTAGRYMNFDPTGATSTPTIGINVYTAGKVVMQFDQPFNTSGGNGVTSNIELDILDQAGNLVTSGRTNTVAQQMPMQLTDATLAPGLYQVAIKVNSGADPGHVVFYAAGNSGFSVDHKFGSAGQTFYPSTHGHNAGERTISVGAVPFYGAPPFTNPATVVSEPFSSTGPVLQEFNFLGQPVAPTLLLKPDVSAPDGGNTSFFAPGNFLDTTRGFATANPPYPGNPPTTFTPPTTATNQSQANLPAFFGTSSAAPDLAAVAALMKQVNPFVTRDEILQNFIGSTTPLNFSAKGVWNPQGGFGLVNAVPALTLASQLRVTAIAPGGGAAVGVAPGAITVTFSKPVDLRTVTASDLLVFGPNGATVTVGQPVGVDSATFPTIVSFPIQITPAPGRLANGVYTVQFVAGPVVSQSGQRLQSGLTDTFNLQQLNPPQVTNTAIIGRFVSIQFSQPMNPLTINQGNLFIVRANTGTGDPLFNPNNVYVSNLPGATFTYNPTLNLAVFDLTNVAQSSLPSDHYAIVVSERVTDLVGNPLNGAFNGVFPSGIFPPAPTGTAFLQDLGILSLPAPVITSLTLAPASDTGIPGDNNTNNNRPNLIGQVVARFPTTPAGLVVYVEFNGIPHAGVPRGGLDLQPGQGGRGFTGQYDATAVTDAFGRFSVAYPAGAPPLPEGQNRVRAVVVGQTDNPPFPGLSATQDTAFRIDSTLPYVGTVDGSQPTSIPNYGQINGLTNLSISVVDPVNPLNLGDPFAVSPQLAIPALDPGTVANVQNYLLFRVTGATTVADQSSFIKTATFVSTSARSRSSDPYSGRIDLTFGPGLPQGHYIFFVLSSGTGFGHGIADAAGNPFAGTFANSAVGAPGNFQLDFDLQPTPTFITAYNAYSADPFNGNPYAVTTGPRAAYEIPLVGQPASAPAPPTAFTLDFSNPLYNFNGDVNAANAYYSRAFQLARSATSSNGTATGTFGTFGTSNDGNGYSLVPGTSVQLINQVQGATFGQAGYQNRLLITLPTGFNLAPDYYRFYLPNNGPTAIIDIYGSQLDGEFQGYQNASGKYVNQLPTGQIRGSNPFEPSDLTGDGIAGGAFMTGFVVVPNGNVIHARPDALYNPQIPSQIPNGTAARPYPVLAPQAVPNTINGGDLNSTVNSGTNFNLTFDRAGLGSFQPSAFFAAQQLVQANGGPVVILAEASIPTRDPITGALTQRPFVLRAPAGPDQVANDASAAIPTMTTLIFEQGTALKMQNAALLVQNQGSALQVLGGPNSFQQVIITSYKDSSVGGATNGDATSVPASGDYGGIVFRNFDQYNNGSPRSSLFPGQLPLTGNSSIDRRLNGPIVHRDDPINPMDAVSGADDIMSYINFLVEKYAGGAVPQSNGFRYDGVTIQNSRPTITNTEIAFAGVPSQTSQAGPGSAQAGLSVNVDALRQDDVAAGPLLRGDTFTNNGLNGIYIRGEIASGIAEPTNAVNYATNSPAQGGARNYVLNDPYPYLLTTRLVIGSSQLVESGGTQAPGGTSDRLYVNPGMLVKFVRGAALETTSASASLNVGDQTYIRQYDGNRNFGPSDPNFRPNSPTLAKVVFTSFFDDTASTSYFDPLTQQTTVLVQPLPAGSGGSGPLQPTPGNVPDLARWGGVIIDNSGTIAVINSTIFRYGGGTVNTSGGTGTAHVLEVGGGALGARVSITNNTFNDNADAPINLQPDSLLAGDPQRPLLSGDPFIHGNLFVNNDVNAVVVQGGTPLPNRPNLNHDSVWTGTDFTYVLRATIVLAGGLLDQPSATQLVAQPKPVVNLTLQSTLPSTILADGTSVAAPGIPLIIKEQGGIANLPQGSGQNGSGPLPTDPNYSFIGGAGFIVGADNGIDPPANPPFELLVDNGAFSQIRIVGIGGNQATGQTRVPVIITSIHDNTVGTTVGNTTINTVLRGDTVAPQPGDGGVILFGANSLTNYALQDPRSGSLIDNADIRYISRIEQQGGGLIYTYVFGTETAFNPMLDSPFATKIGLNLGGNVGYSAQYNQAKQLTISNSNLASFSDSAFIAHPGYPALTITGNYNVANSGGVVRLASYLGEPTHTYFVNDTISNMRNVAIQLRTESVDNVNFPSPSMAVFLNNTFYNVGAGIVTEAPVFDGRNDLSHVSLLAMDNIFSNIAPNATYPTATGIAVQSLGQNYMSDLQYNLFGPDVMTQAVGISNSQPVNGNPAFRDPANGNFFLLSNSDAIDRARSELGPSIFGDMLSPAVTIDPNNINAIPIRNQSGAINPFGGRLIFGLPPGALYDTVTLPGEPVLERGFPDLWVPTLSVAPPLVPVSATAPVIPGTVGTGSNGATYAYTPIVGERDQAGNFRQKDINAPRNYGFGTRPVFDIGAFEYIIQNPPVVTAITASLPNVPAPVNLYNPGGIAGANQAPQSILVQFNEQLDPATLNGMSVILLASGGDGIFGNMNSPADRAINLSGRLAFDPATNTLTINTSGLFPTGILLNDQYRLILKGTGSNIIKDRNGLALDGYTKNDTLPLPSGSDQFPGSDFMVDFTVSTSSPSIVAGSFRLAPGSDTSGGSSITRTRTPTFIGTITDVFPPINPLVGDQVFVDISTRGDGNYDILNAATGVTDATGNFSVTVTSPLPQTPYIVNPTTGIQGFGDLNVTFARVRVINAAGNASATINSPGSVFLAQGALTAFEIDTIAPRVTAFGPSANVLAPPDAAGNIPVTATFSKNIKPSTLNANSIQVFRAGGGGSFVGNGIQVPIDPNSFRFTYLRTPSGAVTVQFNILGPLPNDLYRIILKGTGANPITDIAGNPLDGANTGVPGSDFVNGIFVVYSPTNSRPIYVGNQPGEILDPLAARGTRANPYLTINAGIAVANTGDNVLVLPGTYYEDVILKGQVRLLSANAASTDAGYLPGSPYDTLIYGVAPTGAAAGNPTNVVTGFNLNSIVGVPTEVSGFSIIAPLLGNPVTGVIDTTSSAVALYNASVLVDKNYIINAGVGVNIATSGTNAATPTIATNVIAGNITGIGISDTNSTSSLSTTTNVFNNTIVDNTFGLYNTSSTPGIIQSYVVNDIFYNNHELTSQRFGTGIFSNTANTLVVGNDLFFANGVNNSPGSQAVGLFTGFNPAALSATLDVQNNFLADPRFTAPRDPRPNGDTPPVFFLDGSYDLTGRSPAVNAANPAVAPATDILYRVPVPVAGHGFPGTGPASIGAFYYLGTGGITFTPVGGTNPIRTTQGTGLNGQLVRALAADASLMVGGSLPIGTKKFDVVTTSLSIDGVAGGTAYVAAPSFIDVDFSNNVVRSTVVPSDLILSGSGLQVGNPAKATGLEWVDTHTVRFLLTGGFNPTGTVNLTIPSGKIKDTRGDSLVPFADSFTIGSAPATPTSGTTSPVAVPAFAALSTATGQPVAVPGPVAVNYGVHAAKSTKHASTKSAHPATPKASHATPKPAHKVAAHKVAAPKAAHPKKGK